MYEGEYTRISRLLVSEVLHDLAGLMYEGEYTRISSTKVYLAPMF
jgi:hypothetical protein